MDNSIHDLLKEQYNARIDYDKKQHSTLDDRLNADMSNVHKRFNQASLLQYEGEYITADNSYKGSTEELKIKGRTLQNLCNSNGEKQLDDGNGTQIVYNSVFNPTLLKNGAKYTVQFEVVSQTNNPIITITFGTNTNSIDGNKSIQVTEVGIYKTDIVYIGDTPNLTNIRISQNQVTEGKTAKIKNVICLEGDKPIPPYFEGIRSVAEEGESLVVKSCGKNLFDGQLQFGNLDISSGLEATSKNIFCSKNFLKIKPATQYCILSERNNFQDTCYILEYDINKNYLGYISKPSNCFFTTKYNTVYIKFRSQANDVNGYVMPYDISNCNIQLEEGTTVTSCEPYAEDKLNMSILQDLRGLDDNICDFLDMESGKFTRNVGKIVLNGNETWTCAGTHVENTNYAVFHTPVSIANDLVLSDKFPTTENTVKPNYQGEGIIGSTKFNVIYVRILKSRLTGYLDSLTDAEKEALFKAWLKANPVTVYYQLATPTVEIIEGVHQLRTFDGTTHIWTEGSLISPTIQCKVPSNVQAVVQGLRSNVSTLSLENTNLKNSVEENTLNSIKTNVNQEERLTKIEMGVK